jgi:hypothetical protein
MFWAMWRRIESSRLEKRPATPFLFGVSGAASAEIHAALTVSRQVPHLTKRPASTYLLPRRDGPTP